MRRERIRALRHTSAYTRIHTHTHIIDMRACAHIRGMEAAARPGVRTWPHSVSMPAAPPHATERPSNLEQGGPGRSKTQIRSAGWAAKAGPALRYTSQHEGQTDTGRSPPRPFQQRIEHAWQARDSNS